MLKAWGWKGHSSRAELEFSASATAAACGVSVLQVSLWCCTGEHWASFLPCCLQLPLYSSSTAVFGCSESRARSALLGTGQPFLLLA